MISGAKIRMMGGPGTRSMTPAAAGPIRWLALAAAALVVGVAACSSAPLPSAVNGETGTPATATEATGPGSPVAAGSNPGAAALAQLVIDDGPRPDRPYRREEWPHWDDLNGNGCDAREKALIAQSTGPVATGPGCRIQSGSWVSPYDGLAGTNPSSFQIDHLVPLANAHLSGGWRWEVGRRRAFANDPEELVVASASSNQAKSDKTPDQWRPAEEGDWCTYATGWLAVKVTYGLTATTSERDALGQMLETCPLP